MSSGQQQVLLKLRKMILAGELQGGSRIAEIPTAELLNVSRQPVRMAFRLLEQEGLLLKNPTRGYTVREISADLIYDALEVRGVLEGLAAKTLAERGLSDEERDKLQDCIVQTEALFAAKSTFDDDDTLQYHDLNVIFHDVVIQGAGNLALMQALSKNNQLPMASAKALTYDQDRALSEYQRLHYAHLQHCAIFDALTRRQAGRAESLMREHSGVAILGETVKHILAEHNN